MPLGFLTSVAEAFGVAMTAGAGAAIGAGARVGTEGGFVGGLAGEGRGTFFFDGVALCASGLSGAAGVGESSLGAGVGAGASVGGAGATATGGASTGADGTRSAPVTTLAEPSGLGAGSA